MSYSDRAWIQRGSLSLAEEETAYVCFLDVPFLHKIQATNKCCDDSGSETGKQEIV